MVSARSLVVFLEGSLSLFLLLRMSLASMLTLATSFTMQPIFSLEFDSRCRSKVVFPAQAASESRHRKDKASTITFAAVCVRGRRACQHPGSHSAS